MIKCVSYLLLLMFAAGAAESPSLVPLPAEMERLPGAPLRLPATGPVVGTDGSAAAVRAGNFLARENRWTQSGDASGLLLKTDSTLPPEGYRLTVRPEGIELAAADYAGFFNGSRTLRQLLRANPNPEPVRIVDQPRFRWRGAMIDTARHFAGLDFLKRTIDRMAEYKLNVLHLHFCDDQGWRLESSAYPKLTESGAWRARDPWLFEKSALEHFRPDGQTGGFYTAAELRELVAYAAARNITIVPELEMPAHSSIPIRLYPELVRCNIKGGTNVYCAGKASSYEFLETLLREVMAIFPSRYIHLGFDERRTGAWEKCPDCQARIKQENLADTAALQRAFARRMVDFLKRHGRVAIGWDELLQGGGANLTEAAIMARFESPRATGVKPALAGHEMILTSVPYCYFDYAQGPGEPKAPHIGGDLPKVYSFEPLSAGLPRDKQPLILGAEGTIWSEFMPHEGHMAYMLFPRLIALAEVLWSPADKRNFADFRRRVAGELAEFDRIGYSYRPLEGLLTVAEANGLITLKTPVPGATLRYTLDGSYPDEKAPCYTAPFANRGIRPLRVAIIGPGGNRFPLVERTLGRVPFTVTAPVAYDAARKPENIWDDDLNAYYLSRHLFPAGGEVVMTLAEPVTVSGLKVLAAKGFNGRGGHEFVGRVLVSADGVNFVQKAEFRNGLAEYREAPHPVKVIKLVADQTVKPYVMVREITLLP